MAVASLTLVVGACSPGGSPGSTAPVAAPAGAASADGQADRTLYSFDGGLIRTIHVHHPASAKPGAPLVLVLHGGQGSGLQAERDFGWDALADREGIVVAYPDGATPTWGDGVDDAGYLHSMIGSLVAGEQADSGRVFAVGLADGGTQAYALACDHPGDLAGVGAVAAAPAADCAHPAPITVATVLGADDHAVTLAAGPHPGLDSPALERALAPYRAADQCAGLPAAPLGSAAARSAAASTPVSTLRAGTPDSDGPAVPGGPAAGHRPVAQVPAAHAPAAKVPAAKVPAAAKAPVPAGHAANRTGPAATAPAADAPMPAAGRPAAPGRSTTPVAGRPAPAPTTSVAGPVAQRSWTCATGHSVSVAVVAGTGHQWPGSTARSAGLDEPSGALDATAWLWSHLRTTRTS